MAGIGRASNANDKENKDKASVEELEKKFDEVKNKIRQILGDKKDRNELSDEHFLGIMTAPWTNCQGATNLLCMQDAKRFGLAKRKYFPDENGGKK